MMARRSSSPSGRSRTLTYCRSPKAVSTRGGWCGAGGDAAQHPDIGRQLLGQPDQRLGPAVGVELVQGVEHQHHAGRLRQAGEGDHEGADDFFRRTAGFRQRQVVLPLEFLGEPSEHGGQRRGPRACADEMRQHENFRVFLAEVADEAGQGGGLAQTALAAQQQRQLALVQGEIPKLAVKIIPADVDALSAAR